MKNKWFFFVAGIAVGFGMAVMINLSAERPGGPRSGYVYPALQMPPNANVYVQWRQASP